MESLFIDMEAASQSLFDVSLLNSKKKAMKRLTCRKCEGHGLVSILKGHASACPYNNCTCSTCHSVMNMRANALVRRFKHRQPGQPQAVLKTIRSKNGNMRLKIVARSGIPEEDSEGTTITYSEDSKAHSGYSSSASRRSSAASTFTTTTRSMSPSSIRSSMPSSTTTSSPAVSPPLLSPCLSSTSEAQQPQLDSLLTAKLLQQFLTNYQQSLLAFTPPSAFTIVKPNPLFQLPFLPLTGFEGPLLI